MTKPPLPQPQIDSAPITFNRYCEHTLEKLELLVRFMQILLCSAKNLIKRGFLTCEGA